MYKKAKRLIIILALFVCSANAFAQYNIRGFIKEKGSRNPVAAANVFLSNTQKGVITNADGSFQLFVAQGEWNLVVSCVGFQTQAMHISGHNSDSVLFIYLVPSTRDLGNVTVQTTDHADWKTWNPVFKSVFLGYSSFAQKCSIQNDNMLHYHYDSANFTLTAYASHPLVIINKALGYRVQYQLEGFTYNTQTRELVYYGYPLFYELDGSPEQQHRWEKNRSSAYFGSVMHFMRAVYRNVVKEEGFQIKKLIKQPNLEKQRVKALMDTGEEAGDSLTYYHRILREDDEFNTLSKQTLTGDSIAYASDSITAGFQFEDYLNIKYKDEKTPAGYRQWNASDKDKNEMVSQIKLNDSTQPLLIQSNGMYYPVNTMITYGYWSWSERIARLLPFDYVLQPLLPNQNTITSSDAESQKK